MAVVNFTDFEPVVWIPPGSLANWKVVIRRLDGVEDDVTDIITTLRITDACTDSIGNFEIEFPNSDEQFTGLYAGMEDLYYYCDYDANPTGKRFHGKVEKPSLQGNTVRLTGRSSALFLADANVVASFNATDAADILRAIVTLKGGGRYTTNNVVASTGVMLTVNWNKPFLECVKDLCTATGNDFVVDADDDVHFFPAGSWVNSDEGIVHDFNLVEIGSFAPDVSQVKNRVRVTGAENNGVQIVYTAGEDTNAAAADSQSLYGVKELPVQDNSLTDVTSAKEYGDYLLSEGLAPPIIGEAKSILLATIQPGQSIMFSSPADGIDPSNQNIVKVLHEIGQNGIFTTVTINKTPRTLSAVLRKRVEAENRQQSSVSNAFNLDFSYPFYFDVVQGSFSNTTTDSGVLRLVAAGSGTWISPILPLSSNVSAVSVMVDAEKKTAITMEASGDGGITYESISEGSLLVPSTAAGANLCFKLTITDVETQVKGVALYYSIGG